MEVRSQLSASVALSPRQEQLDKGLGELWSRSGCCGKQKDLLPVSGIEPQFFGSPEHGLVTMPTELPRLPTV